LTAGFALSLEGFAFADLAGVVAAGVEFVVVTALCGGGDGGLATQPNNISRVTWTANNAFIDSHMSHPLSWDNYTAICASIIFGMKHFVTGTNPGNSDVILAAARGANPDACIPYRRFLRSDSGERKA
jgi:hypothetical protein